MNSIPTLHSSKIYKCLYCIFMLVLPLTVISEQNQDADIPDKFENIDTILNWLETNYDVKYEIFKPVKEEALQMIQDSDGPVLKAKLHYYISAWYDFNGLFPQDSTITHSEKALRFYRESGDSLATAKALSAISMDYLSGSQIETSLTSTLQALSIYEKVGDQAGIAGCYKNLSSIHLATKEPEKAIEYAKKALSILDKLDDNYTVGLIYLRLMTAYNDLGQYPEAIQIANACIELVETKMPDQAGIVTRAYGHRYTAKVGLEEYEDAKRDAVKAWQIAYDVAGEAHSDGHRFDIGQVLMLQGEYEEALPHLEAVIKQLENNESTESSDPYAKLAECYQALDQYEKALKYFQKASSIDKRILEEKVKNLKSESIIKYETNKKDQELLLQKEELLYKTKIQRLVGGVAGILSLLLLLLLLSFSKNKEANRKLAVKNKENELLLKEIHHRVKNNLQTISSLLNLQSESITDHAAYDAVQESKNRVASMALIHQKLYQGENLAAIEMKDYFKTISSAVKESFGEKAKNVDLKIEMNDLELDVDTAVPIGLITNELLTNSFKYAFTSQEDGTITIKMSKADDDIINLQISDNGRGFSSSEGKSGFGTLLVQLLSTQLGGTIERSNEEGTSIVLKFKELEKSVA